jgi:hypothetical protein
MFDFGLLYNRKKIIDVNEVISQGLKTFKKAVSLQDFDNEYVHNVEDYLKTQKIIYSFKMLIKSLACFIIADEYEILLELIKGELKS